MCHERLGLDNEERFADAMIKLESKMSGFFHIRWG